MNKFNKLNEELNKNVPELSSKIKSSVNWKQIKLQNEVKKPKFSFNLKFAFLSMSLLLIVCLSVILPIAINNNDNFGYNLFIDVNPSIKLTVDKSNNVINQKALNEDGVILLYKEQFIGKNVDDATKIIVDKMKNEGIIVDKIKIAVKDKNDKFLNKEQDKICNVLKNYLKNDNIDLLILNDEEIDGIEDYFENHNITEYEKQFIKQFKDKLIIKANEKINAIDNLIVELQPYYKNSNEIIQLFNKESLILNFSNLYKYEIDLDFNELTYKDIFDFVDELKEYKVDFLEDINEIDEENDDYGELLEDLFELVKDELFDEN